MTDFDKIVMEFQAKLKKAISHFEYSLNKVESLPTAINLLDEESLETWESFSARFSRVVDIFLTKYLRAKVLKDDPGFTGTLRDFVNQGEKLELVDNARTWMEIRELRNIVAHEYTEEETERFLKNLLENSKYLLTLKEKIET